MEEAILEPSVRTGELIFQHLPGYARHIRDHYLKDYIRCQLKYARELDTPLLKIFGDMPDEQIVEASAPGHSEFLTAAEENTLRQLLEQSMEKWVNDKLEIVARDQIQAQDITQVSFLRKHALLQFLPTYTTDLHVALAIVRELDRYILESDSLAMNTYMDMLQHRISEHTHFIESITNTTPGIIYVFDIVQQKEVYSNMKAGELLGYTQDALSADGRNLLEQFMHPDDVGSVRRHLQSFRGMGTAALAVHEYRVRNAAGEYRWLRAYESVFRRDRAGQVQEIIGIAQDVTEDKLRAEALKHSGEQLLEAQRIADMGNFEWDLVNHKVDVSPQLLKVLDLEHTGDFESFLNKVHPGDKTKVRDAIAEGMQTGNYECEYRLYNTRGEERIIWSRGVISFEGGQPSVFRGTVMDVTEKHHMVQRLQRSEELYKQAQALSQLGNWTWDLIHHKFSWADELYRIYGLEPGIEINYQMLQSFNHPEDLPKIERLMRLAVDRIQPFEFYYRIYDTEGNLKHLHVRGEVLADEGKPFKLVGTLQDVTRQQLVEQQLRNSQEFIQKIANTTPSLIASYNINTGTYTFINKSLYTILGYEPAEALKKGVAFFLDIIHPEDLGPLTEKNARALEEANEHPPQDGNEMVVEFKYRMRHRNGTYHWFHTFGTIFDRDSQGKVAHVLNVSIDITEQEVAEQELQQKNRELQQSNASLEEYAYVASHDLKEPLRKIATFSDRLMTTQRDRLGEDGKLYLTKIIDSSRRMQTMVSDLLSVSVLSGNKVFQDHSLKTIFQEALQTLEYKIEEKQAQVGCDDLPDARIVGSQFRQLFQNLIGNSLKFAREGVRAEIRVTHKYLKPEDISGRRLAKAARYLQLDITDNGIGFDNQFSNKIFTIFQRLHGTTEYEGTGIGLAICKKIAENHGGIIEARGVLNKGSVFTVIIPV